MIAARLPILRLLGGRLNRNCRSAVQSVYSAAGLSAAASSNRIPNDSPSNGQPLEFSSSPVQSTRMGYVEKTLLRKHEKQLELDSQKNIYDCIDSMEWNSIISEGLLIKAIRMLADLSGSVLSDRELAILISSTGRKCQMISVQKRIDYLNQLLKCLKDKGIKFGLAAENALLSVKIDNGMDVNPVDVLQEFQSGLAANAETYGQLARIYAKNGDVAGIIEIIKQIKNIGMRTNDQMLESLVYALASAGQDDKAKSVIEHTIDDTVLADQLRVAFALAKAERFEDDNMIQILNEMVNLRNNTENFLISLHEIVFSLAVRGNADGLQRISSFFPVNCNNLDSKKWNSVVRDRVMRFINGENENIAAAALLLDFIPNSAEKGRLKSLLTSQFRARICKYKNIAEAVKICMIFEKCHLMKHPLRHYLREMAYSHAEKFHDLYEIYTNIEDFKELQGRSHLRLPIVLRNFKKLSNADSLDEKCALFANMVENLHPMNAESCGDRYEAIIRDLMVIPLLTETDVISPLLHKFANNDEMQCFITDHLFDHLLQTKQMDRLKTLLNGPLEYARPGRMFPHKRLLTAISNGLAYTNNLQIAAKLLKVLFPISERSNGEYNRAVQMISDAIISSDLKKTRSLCEVWSKERRVMLRVADKEELLKTLDRNGEPAKKPMVLWLRQKDAWSESSSSRTRMPIERVESAKERKVDAKSKEEVAENLKKKEIIKSLRQAVKNDNLDMAREIWITGSSFAPVTLGLMLAEKMYNADMSPQFESVLLKLKERNIDISYDVISTYQSSDASDKQIHFLEKVSEILGLSAAVKQQLFQNTRMNAFHKHIKQKELNKALELLKVITEERKSVYGQLDLIGAAIQSDDTSLITEVLNIVRTHHGKESSILDLCVALIEQSKFDQVKQLIENSNVMMSTAKLKYYTDRQLETTNLDAMLHIFELFYDAAKINKSDLDSVLIKVINHYGKQKNSRAVELVDERLQAFGFRPNPELGGLIKRMRARASENAINIDRLADTDSS